jgi:mannobiose 2-epimerase
MWDSVDGGFFWLVSRGGVVRPEPDGRIIKRAYGNAFGIYGLAEYYAESHDAAALDLAQRAFRWLDRHAHDPVHAGYFQYMERDGTPLPDGYQHDPPKDQNSSIHIMEAFTELYRVWPDSVLRARLAEMLVLIRDRIRTDPGYLHLFFSADWTPIVNGPSPLDHISYGHDVETAYLLLEASQALGLRDDTLTLHFAKQMVDHALATGWDTAVGGFYDEGYGTKITRPTKNWWAQAEGLNALLLMADLFPADPHGYYACFLKQWSYVDTYLIDHTYGGWYEGGLDKEPERRRGLKAHIWKAAYHDGRALMNVILELDSVRTPGFQ